MPRVGSHAAAAKTSSLYDLSKARGVQWASGGAPGGLKMGAFLLAFCGNRRPVRSLFLFRLYFVCPPLCLPPPPPASPADGRNDLVGGGGTSLLCSSSPGRVSGEGHSGQWVFTWNIRGGPLPSEGWAWGKLQYLSRPPGI